MLKVLSEHSLWYVLLCAAAGALYAYVLYTRSVPWGKLLNYTLAFGRFVVVTLLCFLLLGPYIKRVENYFEKPVMAFLIDNSRSIALVNDSLNIQKSLANMQALAENLQENGYITEIRSFSPENTYERAQDISFSEGQSNLSKVLDRTVQRYENQNLAGIVLLTDGIYNQGTSPLYNTYGTPITTVGIGDSLAKVDINLKTLYANRIAYLDNKFPIQAEIRNQGFASRTTEVQLLYGNKVLATQPLSFAQEEDLQKVEFTVTAEAKGLQRYVVRVVPLEGEFTTENNTKNLYIDILDSKERILLVAASPHPDIKALRASVEKGKNYQFDVWLPAFTSPEQNAAMLKEKYDLIIFYQLPNRRGIDPNLMQALLEKQTSQLFVVGTQSSIPQFNSLLNVSKIQSIGTNFDRVTPVFNNRFERFTFDDDKRNQVSKYPPVVAPFGEYALRADFEVVLQQRVGSIATDKPLLAIGEQQSSKIGILFAEGIWQWRLQEFALNQNHDAFDDLIGKVVQYLSSKEDKRKFRVYPSNTEYSDFETVFFETEAYNDLYELVYGQRVSLTLTNEAKEERAYTYTNSRAGFRYAINGLPEGIYRYVATAELGGKIETSSGEFSVRKLEIEAINTQADFNLLRQLSLQNSGTFYFPGDWQQIAQRFAPPNKVPDIIHSQENIVEMIDLPWLLVVVLVLLTAEWVVRKYKGSY